MQTTKYFTNCTTLDTLTKERNRLAKLYHPDLGGDVRVMQEINAQFEAAKKLLSAPPASRTYACPRSPWDDLYSQMQEWAKDVERQRKQQEAEQRRQREEQKRQQYREHVNRLIKTKRQREIEWAWDQLYAYLEVGGLKDCPIQGNQGLNFLYVQGKTYPYKEWLKAHGFRWDPENTRWYFHTKPANFQEDEKEEQTSDTADFDLDDIPW